MNYPCFDFPIDVSHETWLLSPLPTSIPALLLTVLLKKKKKKTYKDPKTKREKKSSCHRGRDVCVPSLVWALSMNTINLFRKRKRTAETEKKALRIRVGSNCS